MDEDVAEWIVEERRQGEEFSPWSTVELLIQDAITRDELWAKVVDNAHAWRTLSGHMPPQTLKRCVELTRHMFTSGTHFRVRHVPTGKIIPGDFL